MFALLFFFTTPRARLPDPLKGAGEEKAGARSACRRGAAGVPASGGRRGLAACLRAEGGRGECQKIENKNKYESDAAGIRKAC